MIIMLRVIHKRDEPIDILLFNRDNKSGCPVESRKSYLRIRAQDYYYRHDQQQ